MITLQNSNNSEKYEKLYKAANNLLNGLCGNWKTTTFPSGTFNESGKFIEKYTGEPKKYLEPEESIYYTLEAESLNEIYGVAEDDDYPGINIEDYDNDDAVASEFKIDTLGEYFNVIGTLGKIHPRFARLPIDEEIFNIDLDTRRIITPAGNKVYAVVGDHVAEVIYFSVPRYFDMVDLGSDQISIIIQTSTKDRDGNVTNYIFEAQHRDLDSLPDHLIFGWPIAQYITQTTNSITFSVRFYNGHIETDYVEDALKYSLGTQPTTLPVLQGLDFQGFSKKVLQPYLQNYDQTGTTNIEKPEFVDFDQPESGVLTTAIELVPRVNTDSTNLVYSWKYKNKGTNSFVVLNDENLEELDGIVLNDTKDYTLIDTLVEEYNNSQETSDTYITKEDYFNTNKTSLAYDDIYGFKVMVEDSDNFDSTKTYYKISDSTLPLILTTIRGGQYLCEVVARKGRMTSAASSNIVTIDEASDLTLKEDAKFNNPYGVAYNTTSLKYEYLNSDLTPSAYITAQELAGDINFVSGNNIIHLNDIQFESNTGVRTFSNVMVQQELNKTYSRTNKIGTSGELIFYKPIPKNSIATISSTTGSEASNVQTAGTVYIVNDANWTVNITYIDNSSKQMTAEQGANYRKRYYSLEMNGSPIYLTANNSDTTNFNDILEYIVNSDRINKQVSLTITDIYDGFNNELVRSNSVSIIYSPSVSG